MTRRVPSPGPWAPVTALKIGRVPYIITPGDVFMDNGACVQLLTQGPDYGGEHRRRPNPVLSKKAIKELKLCNRVREIDTPTGVTEFSVCIPLADSPISESRHRKRINHLRTKSEAS